MTLIQLTISNLPETRDRKETSRVTNKDKAPTPANKKDDLAAWLKRQGVEADINMLKAELLKQ
ncbi:jg25894, partial [Pararge aegeria aegeria]